MINKIDYATMTITKRWRQFFVETARAELFPTEIELKDYTTFGVGGKAKNAFFPTNIKQLEKIIFLSKCYGLPYYVLGRGSNTLASDDGYGGVLIALRNNFSQIDFKGETITAQAGALTCQLAKLACEKSLCGAEFLALLPASVGGAVTMNAGCFGYSFSDLIVSVEATNGNGIEIFTANKCGFGYRKSIFQENGYVIGSVKLKLKRADKQNIETLTSSLRAKKYSQPLGERTAGSVFLNGEIPSAKLIDECGLKGFKLGGAEISAKHANFIVNKSNATQKDISTLIDIVKNTVFEKKGIILNTEIKFLGD